MSAYPGSPRLLHGSLAIQADDTPGAATRIIRFQYNPGDIRRTLTHRRPQAGTGTTPQDARLVAGPPTETLTLSIELDATDALGEASPDRATLEHGLHRELAALEMLMYPASARYEQITQDARNGRVGVEPGTLPLVLLNWGDARVVPVLLTSFSIAEQEFDTALNPIRAKVDLSLQVLTYLDLDAGSSGVDAFLSYQKEKERLAGSLHAGGTPARTRDLNTEAV